MKFSEVRWLVGPNRQQSTRRNYTLQLAVMIAALMLGNINSQAQTSNTLSAQNPTGVSATVTSAGGFDFNNPFFKSLGTNGRSCVTCHQPSQGWTVSAADVQRRF